MDRERKIIAFVPEKYYKCEGDFRIGGKNSIKGKLNKNFEDEDEARKFLEDNKASVYKVEKVEKKEAQRWPAAPFTTSTLQQEASRKLHLPVSVTMRVAQALYEKGLITYMRTDSTNLSSLALNTSKNTSPKNSVLNILIPANIKHIAKVRRRPTKPSARPL